jgi:hypothetical protein
MTRSRREPEEDLVAKTDTATLTELHTGRVSIPQSSPAGRDRDRRTVDARPGFRHLGWSESLRRYLAEDRPGEPLGSSWRTRASEVA